MKKIFFIFFFVFIQYSILYSQGEIDNQKKIFYRNESTLGLIVNSHGYGVNYRYGKWKKAYSRRIYEIDFIYNKHPKEIRNPRSAPTSNQYYVFGKLNNFYNLRGGTGYKLEMFKKIDKGGVSIKYLYDFGPTIGFLKPIYYIYNVDGSTYETRKIDPDNPDPEKPAAKDSFFKGIGETKINPGAFVKFGLNFEYSTVDELVHALEVGASLDGYIFEVPMMAFQSSQNLFFNLYISYRFGKIIDAQKTDKKLKDYIEF